MITTYWQNEGLKRLYNSNTGVTFYVGLSSTMPTSSGDGVTEPSGNGYARQRLNSFSTPTVGVIANAAELTFPTSSGEWFSEEAPAVAYVIFNGTASTSKVLAAGKLRYPTKIGSSATVKFPVGALNIRLYE